jgi:hypothetical protein
VKRLEIQAGPLSRAGLLALAALAMIPMSCGSSGPELAPVSGTITYNGKPVPKGTVTFASTEPGRRNATGQLNASGKYTLQTENPGDGAELGDYNVTVYAHDEKILDYKPKVPEPPKILAPEKYENPKTSGLKATVKRGSNNFDFPLKDE